MEQIEGSFEDFWICLTPPSVPGAIQGLGVQGAPRGGQRQAGVGAGLKDGASGVGTPTLQEYSTQESDSTEEAGAGRLAMKKEVTEKPLWTQTW